MAESESQYNSPEINAILTRMRDRLCKQQLVKSANTSGASRADTDQLLRIIESRPTAIARSEVFADPESLRTLNETIERVRKKVLHDGKNYLEYPDHDIVVREGYRTSTECERLYWLQNGSVFVRADETPLPKERAHLAYYLSLLAKDDICDVDMTVDFTKHFQLQLEFTDRAGGRRTALYDSSSLPLEQITDDESTITQYYCDRFLTDTASPTLSSADAP